MMFANSRLSSPCGAMHRGQECALSLHRALGLLTQRVARAGLFQAVRDARPSYPQVWALPYGTLPDVVPNGPPRQREPRSCHATHLSPYPARHAGCCRAVRRTRL